MADEDLNAPAAAEGAEPAAVIEAPNGGAPEADSEEALGALYDSILSRDGADPAAEATDKDTGGDKPAGQESDQPQKVEGEPGAAQAITAPHSWSAEMKSKWDAVPPEVRPYIAQRETEAAQQISRMGQEIARIKPIGELVDARMEVFDRHGVAPQQGIDLMLRMQDLLDRDPVQGIQAIAQSMGIDLPAMFGGNGQQQPLDPQVQQLSEQVRQLQHQLTLRDNTEKVAQSRNEERRRAEVAASVEQWGKEKPHFAREDIKKAMGSLIGAGLAADLDAAYDMACNANPEVRGLITAEAKKAEDAKRQEEQARAVADAKRSKAVNLGRRAGTPASGNRWDDERELAAIYDSVIGA